ncbi:hypothetical protein IJG22_01715 [Candidatus Saccharibacteria bacterium]|nr:hypothetical protein [Candidatus Saccharibacteria bacterium]
MVKKKQLHRYGRRSDAVVARRVVLWVITATIVVVIAGLIASFFCNNERMTQRKIDEMAREYYEEFVYQNLINGAMSQEEIADVMGRYEKYGFAPVSLRQLLLYDGRKNMEEGGFVKNYCDENETKVKVYPEAPYDKKSYRIEYEYRCEY